MSAISFLIMDSSFNILYAMVAMNMTILSVNIRDIAIISKSEAINLFENFVLEGCGYI